ncbi:MAG: BON domain-containing protein [Bdellovibrio sp.]
MKKFLTTTTALILTLASGIGAAAPVYDSEGPPGSFSQGKQSTYDAMKSTDRQLAGEARRALEQDKDLSPYAKNINIKVKNRQATLSGAVLNEDEIALIRQKVLAVKGIDSVNNKLKVRE